VIRAPRLLPLAAAALAGLSAPACGGDDAKTGDAVSQGAADEIPKGDAGRRMYFEKRCDEGHYGLCGELALMWSKGWGGDKDKAKADAFYRKACDFAVVDSCAALGIELTPEKELEILAGKCAAGSAFACNNQGQLLLTGTGVAADPGKAKGLLEKGCAGGFASSCRGLANIYGYGLGREKDETKQKEYRAKAAAIDAETAALEVKYFHIPPRDQLPVGRPAPWLAKELKGESPEQQELNQELVEDAAKKLRAALGADGGVAPKD
jgi:TPR repeat protein